MYVLLIFITILVIMFVYYSTNYVKVNQHSLSFDVTEPIKVVHITDLHGKTSFINGSLSKIVNTLDPDIVLITGDLVSNQKSLKKVLLELKKINQTALYFVPGNYERETTKGIGRKRSLTKEEYQENFSHISCVATYLENSGALINIKNSAVSIYGFDNSIYGLEKLENSNQQNYHADIRIIMAHSPNIINTININSVPYHLLLTGHTHGGQLRLFNKTIGGYKHFHVGMKKIDNSFFYISRGIGTVKIPIRFNCPPEITSFYIH
ncbi:metallophosphoesterase [Paenibacillus sp. J22TS3]|uniref:metallophosphoesterase n=1 Tax=Paenibacillus sp. J22TS3 TaxID=2807192 RepID=UPI001B1D74D4|nr:metallophosphoesterase [Paenibacillus sp. J22TS3]GIP24511.1 metallophosphatase [Paenibacillus sp. J22TS3]